jgi:hypothetical protein
MVVHRSTNCLEEIGWSVDQGGYSLVGNGVLSIGLAAS